MDSLIYRCSLIVFIIVIILFIIVSLIPSENNLFDEITNVENDSEEYFVNRNQFLEAILIKIFEIFGVFITAKLMEYLSSKILNDSDFDASILFSVLIIPLLYIIKEAHDIFDVFFIKIFISTESIIVKTGYRFQRIDQLKIMNIENVEIFSTPLGRLLNYGSLMVYSYGSNIYIPHIKNPLEVQKKLLVNKVDASENE